MKKAQKAPFDAVKPGSLELPQGDSALVEYYDDREAGGHFGYLKVTIDANAHSLACDFTAVKNGTAVKFDGQTISF